MPDGKWILVTDAAVLGRRMIRGDDAAREEEGRRASRAERFEDRSGVR